MTDVHDTLLATACRRILELDEPAYIKDSSLRFIAVNEALAAILDMEAERFIGLRTNEVFQGFHTDDWEEKERRSFVFGIEEAAFFDDHTWQTRYVVEIERFISEDDLIYIFARFEAQVRVQDAPPVYEISAPGEDEDHGSSGSPEENAGQFSDAAVAALILEGVSELDAGILVYDKDEVLRYVNEKFYQIDEIYRGRIVPGMRIDEVLEAVHDLLVVYDPDMPAEDIAIAREDWIAGRLEQHHRPYHEIVSDMGGGRFVRIMNRCLPSGVVICLRIDISEQVLLEQKLRRQMNETGLFKEILEDLPVATYVRDENLRLLYANAAYVELVGQSFTDIVGTTTQEMLGATSEVPTEHNKRALATGHPQALEIEFSREDGRQVATFARAKRVIGADGEVFVIGTATDITKIKERERDLMAARQQAVGARSDLENVIDLLPAGVIVLDENLNFELVNQTFCDMSAGQDKAEFIGRPFRDYVEFWLRKGSPQKSEIELDDDIDNWIAMTREGTRESIEILFDDGRIVAYTSMPFGEGRIILTYTDITHLRQLDREISEARRNLKRTESLLRDASEVSEQGLMIIEGKNIAFQNSAVLKIFGLEQDFENAHLWGTGFKLLQDRGEFGTDIKAAEERFRALSEAVWQRIPISRIAHMEAMDRWIKIEVHPAQNDRTVVALTDVTELKKREIELEKLVARAEAADRSKSEFLANMSHEIRTPMNGVLAMAGLLVKTDLDTRQKTFVDVVLKSGKTLLTIINDILDFSRMEGGKFELKHVVFSPAEAVEDVAMLLSGRASERNIDLIVDIDSSVPNLVRSDAGRFRQVVTNLLNNALKFTDFGHVLVRLSAVPGFGKSCELVLTIEDTGIGMTGDKVETLMQSFSYADNTSSQPLQGAGLGLPIVSGLVRLFAGEFDIKSTQGKGTVVKTSIPVAVESARQIVYSIPPKVQGSRILIVDDHEKSRDHLAQLLGRWGFDVAVAENGQEGLDILLLAQESDLPADLVILDYSLSAMTAMELATIIRKNPQLGQPAIVFLAPLEQVTDQIYFSDVNIQALIAKPVRTGLLHETIVGILQSPQHHDRHPIGLSGLAAGKNSVAAKTTTVIPSAEGITATFGKMDGEGHVSILVAEDNEINKVVFTQILQTLDVSFCIVSNGEEAIAAWNLLSPELILMDVNMPVLNGLQATRKIRELEKNSGQTVPIIGVTAQAEDEDFEACLDAGMDDYIAKPLSPERLGAKILKWKIKRPLRRTAAE